MKSIFAFLLLAACCAAGDYSYSGGYYWSGGVAHQRYQSNYWDGCRWCQRYTYRPVEFHAAYKDKVQAAYSEPVDVADRLLEIAELKVKYDAAIEQRKQAAEELREGLAALGLKAPAYSAASTYGGAQAITSGTTVYGYPSVNNVAGLYADGVNLDTKLQQAQRTVDNLAKLVGDANEGNLQAIREVASGRDRAALILAAAQLVSASPGVQSQTTVGTQQPAAVVSAPAAVNLDAIITARCAKCHSADAPKGKNDLFPEGVNLLNWRSFSDDQWRVTVAAVAEGKMPPGDTPLDLSETREFFNARDLK